MEAEAFGAVRIAVTTYQLALAWVQACAAAVVPAVGVAALRAQRFERFQAINRERIHARVRRAGFENDVARLVGEPQRGQGERQVAGADLSELVLERSRTDWRDRVERSFEGGVQSVTRRLGNERVPVIRR